MQCLPLDICKARCQVFKMVSYFCISFHIHAIVSFTTVSAKLLLHTQRPVWEHCNCNKCKIGCVSLIVITLFSMASNTLELCSCGEANLADHYSKHLWFLTNFFPLKLRGKWHFFWHHKSKVYKLKTIDLTKIDWVWSRDDFLKT